MRKISINNILMIINLKGYSISENICKETIKEKLKKLK